jgi:hypothetical protein
MSTQPTDTQTGKPSGQDPMRARERMQYGWLVFALAIALVIVAAVVLRLLIT